MKAVHNLVKNYTYFKSQSVFFKLSESYNRYMVKDLTKSNKNFGRFLK